MIDDLLPPAERRRIARWLQEGRSFTVILNFHQQRIGSMDYRLHVNMPGRRDAAAETTPPTGSEGAGRSRPRRREEPSDGAL